MAPMGKREGDRERSPGLLAAIRKVLNPFVGAFIRAGVAPRSAHILTTRGRKTGKPRSTPVVLQEHKGRRYLVAAYGEVGWVHNVRAHRRVRLTRGRTTEEVDVAETEPGEAGAVLKKYVSRWWPTVAPYFDARRSDPVGAFAAEASRHPVFRLEDGGPNGP